MRIRGESDENRHNETKNKIDTENKIEAVPLINPHNIDEANYFMTLVNEAFEIGIISEGEIVYMQSQISDILADNIWQYTGGASTSVTSEIAADLTESILFVLDCFCLSTIKLNGGGVSNDKCIGMLAKKAGIKNCYAKGLVCLGEMFDLTKNLYNEVYINKLDIEISKYNSTINRTIAMFFKNYNTRLLPHLKRPMEPTFDYQPALLGEIKEYKGVLYVSEYLKHLQLENEFCNLFSAEGIRHLMKVHAANAGFYMDDVTENIFESVFKNAFFSIFLDESSPSLIMKRENVEKITANFYGHAYGSIRDLTDEYIGKLVSALKIKNPELNKYILKYSEKLTKKILFASQRENLHNLIICSE